MSYRVFIDPDALGALGNLPRPVQERIRDAIDDKLKRNPRGFWAKELKQAGGLHRLRVGNYRIVYAVREDPDAHAVILAIGHRQDVYEDL